MRLAFLVGVLAFVVAAAEADEYQTQVDQFKSRFDVIQRGMSKKRVLRLLSAPQQRSGWAPRGGWAEMSYTPLTSDEKVPESYCKEQPPPGAATWVWHFHSPPNRPTGDGERSNDFVVVFDRRSKVLCITDQGTVVSVNAID
jgi:hypothetical protein